MKSLFKTLVLFTAILLSLNVNAADGIAVTVNDNFKVNVAYTNAIEGAQIYLEDAEGERLFSEYTGATANDSKTLSLEELPVGKYYLIYEDVYAKSYTTISRTINGLDIVSDEGKTIFKPSYKVENGLVLISFTNPKEVKTTTRIYDVNGEIIESLANSDLIVKQALDLNALPAGTYRIGVSIGDDFFTKEITLK
ncbi:T9SS type A sorting domain-containing protein [Leeuwenhoekiella parthenopeia]|uniref:T9SS type A sorting domain-containing protein n=1 Tax=Leeuwenhoekiella parthenopeia TaxID=2890320 RepID=A0ABS8GWP9_9FLAO|nr:T9SS type A sorting domain-containing protein [Leeuwenhoekiella parthenopeia]MCC4214362.1 T9SS type A sorting domain-containing protein [Leeuwenhoekiella parthenopeia]